jgi:ferredoxin--NADP+ reductase
MADLEAGRTFAPEAPSADAALAMINSRQPDFVSFADWKKIDDAEVALGTASDRPRVKFTQVAKMLEVARN